MHARLQQHQPHDEADHRIHERRADAGEIRHRRQHEENPGDAQRSQGDLIRIEHRNDQHGAEVIDDGERCKEYFQ